MIKAQKLAIRAVAALTLVAVGPSSFGAMTIYQDDFSGSSANPLNGTTPDITTGNATWAAGVNFRADGTFNGDGAAYGTLPFVPGKGRIYTLSVDLMTSSGSSWTSASYGVSNSIFGNGGSITLKDPYGGGLIQTFLGPSTAGQGPNLFGYSSSTTNVKMVLNTQAALWTVEWLLDNVSVRGPVAYATNPTISNILFNGHTNTAIDNLQLSASSDLTIIGGTVTLTSQETYNGSTYIKGGGTLVNGYSGGALPTGTTLYIGGTDNTTGTFDLGGNGQTVAGLNNQGTGGASNIVTNNGSNNATLTVNGSGTFAGKIQDGSSKTTGLAITGGTEVLSGANTYTGTTNVTSGTLLVNGNQTAATGAVTVASGATLGGNGTLGGATTITGIVSPGNGGIGTLNITSNVTWQGASSAGNTTDWIFQLGASNTADLLNITGNFLKDASLGTNFRFDFGGSAHTGTFKLVDWSGTSSFSASDFSFTNLGSGLTGSFAFNGSQLEFSAFTAIPEPSTWVGALALCAGLLVQGCNLARLYGGGAPFWG